METSCGNIGQHLRQRLAVFQSSAVPVMMKDTRQQVRSLAAGSLAYDRKIHYTS